jgi:Ca2+-binding EF-hand superfamily protein
MTTKLALTVFASLSVLAIASCDRQPTSRVDATTAADEATDPQAAAEQAAPPSSPPVAGGDAAATATDSGMSFTDMDKNMDSGVSRDELAPTEILYQRFNEADTSGDGTLSVAEVERFRSGMAGIQPAVMTDSRSFAQMDANRDGRITHEELDDTDMLERHFEEADADHDGSLSPAEVDAHRAAMATGD